MQIIDSHQHFWKYDSVTHNWITDEMSVLQKNFLPGDLLPIYEHYSISGCIAVQSDQSDAETQFLIDLASRNEFIKGVVGWVDLRAENIHEQLEAYKQIKILKGFRHVLQSEEVRDMMLGKNFQKGIKALEEYGFTYDILILTDQLSYAEKFVDLFPQQKFVLDHMAKPGIKMHDIEGWKKNISLLASRKNVFCKISGMVTEASLTEWQYQDFIPYIDVVVETFGLDRIMFGSDWPVCLLAGSYGEILNIVQTYFSTFSKSEQQKVFADNAVQFYNLK